MEKEKVCIVKCPNYKENNVCIAVKRIFDILDIKKDIGKVLIKPNMLSARKPVEGVTTHPIILKEIIKNLKSEEILIGDSPANANKEIEEYWEKCGFKNVSEETGAKLIKFSNSKFMKLENNIEIPIWEGIYDYKIINVPKFKTHTLTALTLCIKNLYGLIPGYTKSLLHSKFISPFEFSLFLVELYRKIAKYIYLNIVDGVISMEGNGPSSGVLRNTGILIAGKNGIAVDIACCKIAGINVKDVPYLEIYKEKYGLPEIELKGDKIEKIKNFRYPSPKKSFKILSNPLLQRILKILSSKFSIQPIINRKKCKRCFSCYYVCPVKAISNELKINKKKCINCFCCFEVCPYKSIELKKSLLAKIST